MTFHKSPGQPVTLGIDMGHSAIKLVVIGPNKTPIYHHTQGHGGNPEACLKTLLEKTAPHFPRARVGATGTLSGVARALGIQTVDAVPASVEGCLALAPQARCIMEIGAARSRFITGFSPKDKTGVKFFFNSSCSAGTGSFLEEQAQRLNISMEGLSHQARLAQKALPIAGRCSVFSKTDMIHFQQDGAQTPDILLGLIHAMVRNYRANVVKRTPVPAPVFLAGKVMEIHGVKQALAKTFNLAPEALITPPGDIPHGALGAALALPASAPFLALSDLCHRLEAPQPLRPLSQSAHCPALGGLGSEGVLGLHDCKPVQGQVTGYLGVDVGSTSTNLLVLDTHKKVVAWEYLRTRGTPLKTVHQGMERLKQRLGKDLNILATGVTGSGRYLTGKQLEAQLVINEITAQAEGTLFQHPEADTIIEIGGQDSKFIRLENQRVTDFEMNRICAAGTGSFLEEQATKIGVALRKFGPMALAARAPLDLGDRCTVFIEGALAKALGRGEDKANIVAGLAHSIVRNYLTRVAGNRPLGEHVFIQGGIAHNPGVVNAFRAHLKKPVTISPYFSVTGALGAALMVQQAQLKTALEPEKRSTPSSKALPDMWETSQALFEKEYRPNRFPGRPVIGIPRVLFLHKLFVLFNRFFTELGFNVLLSAPTTREMVEKSRDTALEETCYPVKLINGHLDALVRQGVDYIFLPTVYTMNHQGSTARKDYGCTYMQTAAQLASRALDLQAQGVELLSPKISFRFGIRYMGKTILDLGKTLGKTRLTTVLAMQKAALGFIKYNRSLAKQGSAYLSTLPPGAPVFVIITRPYGVNDPILNMSVPQHLIKMGHGVIPLSALEIEPDSPEGKKICQDYPNMYWPFGQHILTGAKKIRNTPNLYAIYLTNHGCGPDTALLHLFRKEMGGKPFLHLEVDEHGSKVGIITRLEAFALSFDKKCVPPVQAPPAPKSEKEGAIHIPSLYPYSELACQSLKNQGLPARVLPPTDRESFEQGRVLGAAKEYLSFVSLMGDIRRGAQAHPNGQFLIPQTEGTEVEGMYAQVIGSLLKDESPGTRILAPFMEDAITKPNFFQSFFLPLVAGDLVLVAHPDQRQAYLAHLLGHLDTLGPETLIETATQVARPLEPGELKVLVTGDPAVVFNPFNHQFLTEEIQSARICHQPLSEVLYLFWEDWNCRKKDPAIQKNLDRCRELLIPMAQALGDANAFEPDPARLKSLGDKTLPLFSGSNGRYRMAKRQTESGAHALLELASAYENTGIITRQLGDKALETLPVLPLVFDGSDHNGARELLRNFMYYRKKE